MQKVKNMADVMHETAQNILQKKREEIARDDMDDKESKSKAKDIISILCMSFAPLLLRPDPLISCSTGE